MDFLSHFTAFFAGAAITYITFQVVARLWGADTLFRILWLEVASRKTVTEEPKIDTEKRNEFRKSFPTPGKSLSSSLPLPPTKSEDVPVVLSKSQKVSTSNEDRPGILRAASTAVISSAGVDMSGWIEKSVKVGLTRVWTERFFLLSYNPAVSSSVWLSWFKDEKKKGDQCYGHFLLNGCKADADPSRMKITVENVHSKVIYHRKADDPSISQSGNNHYMFHKNATRCRLRFKDAATMNNWLAAIRLAIERAPVDNAGSPNVRTSFNIEDDDEGVEEAENVEVAESSTGETDPENDDVFEVINPQEGKVVLVKSTSHDGLTALEQNAAFSSGQREALLPILKRSMDITSLTFPMEYCEPTTFLQQMCERIGSYYLLDEANSQLDSSHRMAYVATFASTMYSSLFRLMKPYHPVLGETFEFSSGDFKFVAEQVSMNPPIGVCHADTANFTFTRDQRYRANVTGNSLSCESIGINHVFLKKTGEHYYWSGIKSIVHNMFIGHAWIDHYGKLKITNCTNNDVANLEFSKCGFFGKGQHEVKGTVVDASGKAKATISGDITDSICAAVAEGGAQLPKAELWKMIHLPDKTNTWQLSQFAQELNHLDDRLLAVLPKTDSRLRPDRIACERKEYKMAIAAQTRLEEEENLKRRTAEQPPHVSKYFVKGDNGDWSLHPGYWENRVLRGRLRSSTRKNSKSDLKKDE